jgi:hypothetical protein
MKNTVEKGTKFEERVFNIMKNLLDTGQLPWANPFCSEVFMQKGYYSRDRKSDIKIDVSIEVYHSKEIRELSMLGLIECKDYEEPIPVGKIEEFYGKTVQIAGLKCKTIFVTSSNFQEGAETFAKSKGIALVRLLHEDQINWVHYEGTPDMLEAATAKIENSPMIRFIFRQPNINLPNINSMSYYNGKYYCSMEKLFQNI